MNKIIFLLVFLINGLFSINNTNFQYKGYDIKRIDSKFELFYFKKNNDVVEIKSKTLKSFNDSYPPINIQLYNTSVYDQYIKHSSYLEVTSKDTGTANTFTLKKELPTPLKRKALNYEGYVKLSWKVKDKNLIDGFLIYKLINKKYVLYKKITNPHIDNFIDAKVEPHNIYKYKILSFSKFYKSKSLFILQDVKKYDNGNLIQYEPYTSGEKINLITSQQPTQIIGSGQYDNLKITKSILKNKLSLYSIQVIKNNLSIPLFELTKYESYYRFDFDTFFVKKVNKLYILKITTRNNNPNRIIVFKLKNNEVQILFYHDFKVRSFGNNPNLYIVDKDTHQIKIGTTLWNSMDASCCPSGKYFEIFKFKNGAYQYEGFEFKPLESHKK